MQAALGQSKWDPDDIEVFTSDPFDAGTALPEKVSAAVAAAQAQAEEHPYDLGGAYYDRSTGEVVTTTVTRTGERIAASSRSNVAVAPVRVRSVTTDYATLRRIQHEAISLGATGLPGNGSVYGTFVQIERNRVVVEAVAATAALRKALADRFGADHVAIHLTPGIPLPRATYGGWRADRSPFLGGARINVPGGYYCTAAFAWRNGGYHGILTAGHCVPNGGPVSSVVESIGNTISNNWNDGTGTVKYPGDPYDRGDLGLVQIPAGTGASDARIYVGGPTSSLWRNVIGRFNRKSYPLDKYCTGGSTTGEICGFAVRTASYDVDYYDNGTYVGTARNVTYGIPPSTGNVTNGDSGGPVYTVDSNGQVQAKGVISGAGPNRQYFTEITDAVNALPGDIATR
ncbi:hypothetical protein [Kribbella pratensis]|nr:hypothetical protein [Kribbella pratensis]